MSAQAVGLAVNALTEAARRMKPVQDQYEAEMVKRFGLLEKQIRAKIVDEGFLGGSKIRAAMAVNADVYDYPHAPEKVKAFMAWLAKQEDQGILEIISYEGRSTVMHTGWQNIYVKRSYSKGVEWAERKMRELGLEIPAAADTAIGVTLAGPFHADALGMLYTRNFAELEGITRAMDQSISRVLTDGLAQGKNPRAIASDLAGRNGRVRKIGLTRARTLARTETARAFDEATLNRYEDYRVEKVDGIFGGGPCPTGICEDIVNAGPYTIQEARGLLPAHPNCTCAWAPAV